MMLLQQSQRYFSIGLILLLGGLLGACGEKEEESGDKSTTTGEKSAEQSGEAETANHFPFDFPDVNTTAAVGEYVLTPSAQFLDKAKEEGVETATFIFYAATVERTEEQATKVKALSGSEFTMPNSLIVPLGPGTTAKKGDILLSWWQSGSGMNRAIVVDDADPSQPVVRYLDIGLDNPAKVDGVTLGEMEEQLKPNTFRILSSEMEPGTAIAVRDGSSHKQMQVIRVEGDKVMALGFAGRMSVVNRADVTPIPVVPQVAAGDNVWFEHIGKFRQGKVKRVDARNGRVFIEYEFGGKQEETGAPFGNVIKEL